MLRTELRALERRHATALPADVAFRLFDSCGFPFDLTVAIARESGVSVGAPCGGRSRHRCSGRESGALKLPRLIAWGPARGAADD
jgi:alanyl-tRNA synthetase